MPASLTVYLTLSSNGMPDLRNLIEAGLSDREIQRVTGIERRQVAKYRREHGYPAWSPTLPGHGTEARYQHHGCRCDDCREAKATARLRRGETLTASTAMPDERRAELDAHRRRELESTRLTATRTMARWTREELAIALDKAYTAADAARIIGRSKSAVEHQRKKRKTEVYQSAPAPTGRRARK